MQPLDHRGRIPQRGFVDGHDRGAGPRGRNGTSREDDHATPERGRSRNRHDATVGRTSDTQIGAGAEMAWCDQCPRMPLGGLGRRAGTYETQMETR